MAAHHRANFTDKKVCCVRIFSHFGLLEAIPYCDEARAACGRCVQLSSYAESEPRSPGPIQLSIVCRQYIVPVTESWAGAWEQDYSFSTQCKSASCLPMITAKKRSPSHLFLLRRYAFHTWLLCALCYTRNLQSLPHRDYV